MITLKLQINIDGVEEEKNEEVTNTKHLQKN